MGFESRRRYEPLVAPRFAPRTDMHSTLCRLTHGVAVCVLTVATLSGGSAAAPASPRRSIEPIRTDGRLFVAGGATFRPVFASALSILTKPPAERTRVLDDLRTLGFNGVRVFAGALTWAHQTPATAIAALPTLLDEAAARGLYVYVVAITDSGTGYDVETHLRRVAAIVSRHDNALLEVANEIGHPTQSARVNDAAALLALARRTVPDGTLWSLGASLGVDAVGSSGRYPTAGGMFNDAHLDRGGGKWRQVGRLREISGISAATGQPVISGEPIGAAEIAVRGRRESDPSFFFAMGALCRGFEMGCVWHSDAGLHAERPGPVQRRGAEAFIAGWRALDTDARLLFVDAAADRAPIAGATHVAHAYAFVAGDRGFLVLLGVTGDPALRFGNGWTDRGTLAERPGVQVRRIGRSNS